MKEGTTRFHTGEWRALARSVRGAVRPRQEDSYRVEFSTLFSGRKAHAFAVFDGLGGLPNGAAASQAAALRLPEVLRASMSPSDVLARLNEFVRPTNGATTAVVALFYADAPSTEGLLLTAGDSGAYGLDAEGRPELLVPKDSAGNNILTDYLGNPHLVGHVRPLPFPPGRALLLCTDGVDGVVGLPDLARPLAARIPEMETTLDGLFAEIQKRGAPDNATAVLARRG